MTLIKNRISGGVGGGEVQTKKKLPLEGCGYFLEQHNTVNQNIQVGKHVLLMVLITSSSPIMCCMQIALLC